MTRVSTPPTAKPVSNTTQQSYQQQQPVSHDRIAMCAYEKWMKRGCPQGTSFQDWVEAEAELPKRHAQAPPRCRRPRAANCRGRTSKSEYPRRPPAGVSVPAPFSSRLR